MSNFSTVLLAGSGVAVNTIDQIKHDQDPFSTILAGGLFIGGCVLVGSYQPKLGTALAVTFLLGSMLYHGTALFGLTDAVISGAPPTGGDRKPTEGGK